MLPRPAIAHVNHYPLHLNVSIVHRNTSDLPIPYRMISPIEFKYATQWPYATALGIPVDPGVKLTKVGPHSSAGLKAWKSLFIVARVCSFSRTSRSFGLDNMVNRCGLRVSSGSRVWPCLGRT
ncbi:hypothetical protein NL676_014571 [Syzygium grande]|nr:hypothetical protein NL676_014571 [Syzygium grande]